MLGGFAVSAVADGHFCHDPHGFRFAGRTHPHPAAATCSATSGATRNRLIELYTSEGCSSCPPADRWLSQLPRDFGVVPLAFHVDYWDRLGWKDRFAQAAFSQRQRDRNRGFGWVYTPQLMLDGEDFRSWHRGLPARSNPPAQASLSLTLDQTSGHIDTQAEIRFASPAAGRNALFRADREQPDFNRHCWRKFPADTASRLRRARTCGSVRFFACQLSLYPASGQEGH